jgi:hypothetical protein
MRSNVSTAHALTDTVWASNLENHAKRTLSEMLGTFALLKGAFTHFQIVNQAAKLILTVVTGQCAPNRNRRRFAVLSSITGMARKLMTVETILVFL